MRIQDYINTINFSPEFGLVLGSGLGDFASEIEVVGELKYCDIEGFPISTVSGHAGRFVFGICGDKRVVVAQGRVHYYEGYPMDKVVMPIYAMRDMGVKTLILTNASGGINERFRAGDLMLITDHIMNVPNPLIGKNNDNYGVRFPDMSEVYDKQLQEVARSVAKNTEIDLREGVYAQLTGPSYETPAEIRMLRTLGASAVGMSTACEAVVANYCGMRVCGISCITNLAAGMGAKLSHEEVRLEGERVKYKFSRLIKGVIESV